MKIIRLYVIFYVLATLHSCGNAGVDCKPLRIESVEFKTKNLFSDLDWNTDADYILFKYKNVSNNEEVLKFTKDVLYGSEWFLFDKNLKSDLRLVELNFSSSFSENMTLKMMPNDVLYFKYISTKSYLFLEEIQEFDRKLQRLESIHYSIHLKINGKDTIYASSEKTNQIRVKYFIEDVEITDLKTKGYIDLTRIKRNN